MKCRIFICSFDMTNFSTSQYNQESLKYCIMQILMNLENIHITSLNFIF